MFFNKKFYQLGVNSLAICTSAFFYKSSRLSSIEKQEISIDRRAHNIFIASNSLIFAPDKIVEAHGFASIILLPFWLEKVDRSHYHNKWGQTPRGLPTHVRELFFELYPDHDPNERIDWWQLLYLREKRIEILKNHPGINVIDLRKASIKAYEAAGFIHFVNKKDYIVLQRSGESKPLLQVEKSDIGKVYNFASLPKAYQFEKEGILARPHTELYYMPRHLVPKIILVRGTGLSAVWIKKHFPDSRLILVTNKNKESIELVKISGNEEVKYDEITILNEDDLLSVPGQPHKRFFAEEDGSITVIDCNESYFYAMGYCANTAITDELPFYMELNLAQQGCLLDKTFPWTAPENIPVGSLTNHLLMFYYLSGWYNDNGYELQYYINSVTPTIVKRALNENGIDVSQEFFDNLAQAINDLKHPLNCEKELQLYLSVYQKTEYPGLEELYLFKRTIEGLQDSIIKRAYDNGFYQFSGDFGITCYQQDHVLNKVFRDYPILCSNY